MSATQTTTMTTIRGWNERKKNEQKKVGRTLASAYSTQLRKASNTSSRKRCPTCGRPL